MKTVPVLKLCSLLILLLIGATPRTAYAAFLPFFGSEPWFVCQGYNTSEVDHVESRPAGKFGLDLIPDARAAIGTYGCNDVTSAAGKKIVAPAAGTIKYSTNSPGEFICLRLDLPFGQIRSINFGHFESAPASGFDTHVEAGAIIGTLRRTLPAPYQSIPPHLHMAAFTGDSCNGATVPFDEFFTGYSFPDLLGADQTSLTHQHYGVKIQPTLLGPSTIDGAGSLVDPKKSGNCAAQSDTGCTSDMVVLHPHGVPSTAIFQVLAIAGKCDFVNIYGLQSANIIVKRWNESFPGAADDPRSSIFSAASLPVSVALTPGYYSTIAVTTVNPIPPNQSRTVLASCGIAGDAQSFAAPADIAPSIPIRKTIPQSMLLPLQGDTFWGGNGSAISFIGSNAGPSASGTGRTTDVAISLETRKSLLMFQVYSGSLCRKVRVSAVTGLIGRTVDVSIKQWSTNVWSSLGVLTLPALVEFPGIDYWLLKVKPMDTGKFKLQILCE